ncbi:ribosome biogenesis GTP-binding protein YihA/YsxC [Moheibacter lacus]|uniref:Probable GTP-binding protein EngB n=1 Tax=Moheibacter lacus TaxID=2745851 RepID=A0A838ZRS8_9FLAO|nr:ribosome biogenesis GTP-binding protein YihA/YsxC [Moheibacter lacus]MBA5629522.1 YihA family ribosome biogenesis GTP-binding protein [Moheibacter lacus]
MNLNPEFIKSAPKWSDCPEPNKPEYAFIGRSNVGKSSLINMLAQRKDLAKTSGTPGKTQLLNIFSMDESWYLTDLPGYGYAKVSKVKRGQFEKMITNYLTQRPNLINTFVLIDCRIPPQKIDLEFMEWLGENQIPFSMVFTKIDKISSTALQKALLNYRKEMLKTWESMPQIFTTSASGRIGRMELLNYITHLNEELKGKF